MESLNQNLTNRKFCFEDYNFQIIKIKTGIDVDFENNNE